MREKLAKRLNMSVDDLVSICKVMSQSTIPITNLFDMQNVKLIIDPDIGFTCIDADDADDYVICIRGPVGSKIDYTKKELADHYLNLMAWHIDNFNEKKSIDYDEYSDFVYIARLNVPVWFSDNDPSAKSCAFNK